jgi:hypothetical protein
MTEDEIEATALAIADAHGCHTVVLYGSRARGDAGEDSDVDLLFIREASPPLRDARLVDGVYFDAFVYPLASVAVPDPSLLRILGGRVLREHDGCGTALLGRVHDLFAKGPEPLAADERAARIVWAHKMLDRLQRRVGVDAAYRRMFLLLQALEDYFALRTRWFRGSKEAFAWLNAHDGPTHNLIEVAMRPDSTHDALVALVHAVYGRLEDSGESVRPG